MLNLEISYVYRDASNNKNRVSVVVANKKRLSTYDVYQRLKSHFAKQQSRPNALHMQPELLGWPTAYLDCHHAEGDLALHEMERIKYSIAPCTLEFDVSQLGAPEEADQII